MNNDQVTIVCYLSREDAAAYRSIANIFSNYRSNAMFAGELLKQGLDQYIANLNSEEKEKLTFEARLAIWNMRTRTKEEQQAALSAIIGRGIDEDAADELHEIAVGLDLDEEKARKFAEESPFASVVAFSSNGSKMGRCQQWLAALFTEHEQLTRSAVIGIGAGKGYHESMVNRASRKLKLKKTKGEGGIWYWSAPKPKVNKDDNNNHYSY